MLNHKGPERIVKTNYWSGSVLGIFLSCEGPAALEGGDLFEKANGKHYGTI